MEAHNWVRWARTPGHDEYWRYRQAFFGDLVPPPGRRALEVGSGEGRVARDLAARGHWVVGLDSSPTLARFAEEAATGPAYILGNAPRLPRRSWRRCSRRCSSTRWVAHPKRPPPCCAVWRREPRPVVAAYAARALSGVNKLAAKFLARCVEITVVGKW